MRRHSTAILIWSVFVGLGIDLPGTDYKRAIEEEYRGKVLYVSFLAGLYGTPASIVYEHTYHVTPDMAVQFKKTKMWRKDPHPNERLPQGAKVEVRSIKVKQDRIEMTIRSAEPVSLGVSGGVVGGVGIVGESAERLEVNLRFDVGQDAIRTGDMAKVQKFVKMLISEQRPQVNIQVGMKLEEVTAQLGEPKQQIQVENKLLLVYPHLTVITEDSKVTEVKVQ